MLTRWRSQPIKCRVWERQPITERLQSISLESYLSPYLGFRARWALFVGSKDTSGRQIQNQGHHITLIKKVLDQIFLFILSNPKTGVIEQSKTLIGQIFKSKSMKKYQKLIINANFDVNLHFWPFIDFQVHSSQREVLNEIPSKVRN